MIPPIKLPYAWNGRANPPLADPSAWGKLWDYVPSTVSLGTSPTRILSPDNTRWYWRYDAYWSSAGSPVWLIGPTINLSLPVGADRQEVVTEYLWERWGFMVGWEWFGLASIAGVTLAVHSLHYKPWRR